MEAMAFSKVCTVYRLRSNYVSNDFNESGPFTKYNTECTKTQSDSPTDLKEISVT